MLSHQGCSCYILKAKLTLKPHHGGGEPGGAGLWGGFTSRAKGKHFMFLHQWCKLK